MKPDVSEEIGRIPKAEMPGREARNEEEEEEEEEDVADAQLTTRAAWTGRNRRAMDKAEERDILTFFRQRSQERGFFLIYCKFKY